MRIQAQHTAEGTTYWQAVGLGLLRPIVVEGKTWSSASKGFYEAAHAQIQEHRNRCGIPSKRI